MNLKSKSLTFIKFFIIAIFIGIFILFFSFNYFINNGKFTFTHENIIALKSIDDIKNYTIIIDPGHGGEDGGASDNGVTEKEINLIIANNLNNYLMFSSYHTAMTRTDDRLLYKEGEQNKKKYHDLINRVAFTNEYVNAIFISIHQNKFAIPKYKGLQVYYSPNTPESGVFAQTVQNNARKYLDETNKRETKQATRTIKVLDMLEVPAILIECGFLSNNEEALLLANSDYQKKLAFMVFISTIEFINETEDLV